MVRQQDLSHEEPSDRAIVRNRKDTRLTHAGRKIASGFRRGQRVQDVDLSAEPVTQRGAEVLVETFGISAEAGKFKLEMNTKTQPNSLISTAVGTLIVAFVMLVLGAGAGSIAMWLGEPALVRLAAMSAGFITPVALFLTLLRR